MVIDIHKLKWMTPGCVEPLSNVTGMVCNWAEASVCTNCLCYGILHSMNPNLTERVLARNSLNIFVIVNLAAEHLWFVFSRSVIAYCGLDNRSSRWRMYVEVQWRSRPQTDDNVTVISSCRSCMTLHCRSGRTTESFVRRRKDPECANTSFWWHGCYISTIGYNIIDWWNYSGAAQF